tara:strand:+ start:1116 stop:1355 length:240 start_codon:yes stop_codon:yes gene_type:complete
MGPIFIVLGLSDFTRTPFDSFLFCVGAIAVSWVLSSVVEAVSLIYDDLEKITSFAESFEMKPNDKLIVEILEKLSELQD